VKQAFWGFVALALLLGAGQARLEAGTIVVNFPEFNGPDEFTGFPLPPMPVATKTYSVAGQSIISETFAGTFGSTSIFTGSTAEFNLLLNGIQVGSTLNVTPDPFSNVVPFSFTSTNAALLASLQTGSAALSVVQLGAQNIRLSTTTLSMTTTPVTTAVPEPASMTMLGIGITGMMGYALRRRRKLAAA